MRWGTTFPTLVRGSLRCGRERLPQHSGLRAGRFSPYHGDRNQAPRPLPPVHKEEMKLRHRCSLLLAVLFTPACFGGESKKAERALGGASGEDLPFTGRVLEVFVGSASKPATEVAIESFQRKTGAKVEAHYGGSGKMLAALKLAKRGDIYFPGSSDHMEVAKREGIVFPETERRVVYLIPTINVQRGNPHNIHRLADLQKRGLRIGIARPDAVCVGLYAVELLEAQGLGAAVQPNIVTQTESCEKTAQLLSLKSVDAIIGWDVFEHWDPENIQTIYPSPTEVTRIGYIPIAVAKSTKDRELAEAFIAFVLSDEGRTIYKRWKYLTSLEEARKYATPTTPVGGEWELPARWR